MADSVASGPRSAAIPEKVRNGPPGGPECGKSPIETMVRSVAIVGALFSVLGLLTTNAYLYKLGVSDFSLLRTRFILTGVLTLAGHPDPAAAAVTDRVDAPIVHRRSVLIPQTGYRPWERRVAAPVRLTRIATAPASARFDTSPTLATARRSAGRHGHPAIRTSLLFGITVRGLDASGRTP